MTSSFLTGTDEHGIKMLQTAAKEKLTPRELVERNVPRFQAMVNSSTARTTTSSAPPSRATTRRSIAIWEAMQATGDIYLDKYSGWYSVRDEAYYDESETRLDDKGQRLGPQGTPVEWVEEESYFFRLSAFADKLLELYSDVPNFVLPKERMNEVASFVRGGLKDLSISRTTFDWGMPVPGNPQAHDVCVGRCADKLHYRRRLSRYGIGKIQEILAGQSACDRQGYRALPRGLLAGLPDVGRDRGAAPHVLPRLSVQPR